MANLLVQKNLTQLVDAVEADLMDSANAQISAAEVQACIRNSIYDLSRHIPLQKIYELTLDLDVENESFTSSLDAAVSLANNPIMYGSEKVETTAEDTTYTRDTDYTMDYSNGTITVLSTGDMSDSTEYYITYTKSKIAVDLSGITDLIRVSAVEYPLGSVPQDIRAFRMWGTILWVVSSKDSQAQMGDTNHLVIYYEAEHNIAVP